MCFSIILFCIFGRSNSNAELIALNNSRHALKLYQEIGNAVQPSEADAAAFDVRVRRKLCAEVTDNEWFYLSAEVPLQQEDLLFASIDHERYQDLVYQIFDVQNFENFVRCEYTNPYRRREFQVSLHIYPEHVFLCLVRDANNFSTISYYYISKEYNVSSIRSMYKPGRFVFPVSEPERKPSLLQVHKNVLLAEEPAKAYEDPGFNVELYYLQIRKYVEKSAEGHDINPLCRLVSVDEDDPKNQHYRFCVSITRSAYFIEKIVYPPDEPYRCVSAKISFKTVDGIEKAAAKLYHELVAPCFIRTPGGDGYLYISRAYMSNQMFVYRYSIADEKMYLLNLSSNISILDELNSFDFVEE